ncbi:hypothetical protein B0J11DRAFT_205274 [Dendryphion nanum]|uniref:F-box domain-containing protein n=1 Tax=Dendryphion nanum TaxID=256645 RepID=A0A9P9D0Y4_9PLEO|nr:hypothetical protein B0J11DRAFT_205274 [Dendryphion nanum]
MFPTPTRTNFFTLPTEIRLSILEYVLPPPHPDSGVRDLTVTGPIEPFFVQIDDIPFYSEQRWKSSILTICRQFRTDFTNLVFSRTVFSVRVSNRSVRSLHSRLADLRPCQIASIRYLIVEKEEHEFQALSQWSHYPFNIPNFNLTILTIGLASSPMAIENTAKIAKMLRGLRNVQTLRIIGNFCTVKGGFKAWYNQLVGLILKEDHRQRYDVADAPNVEETWWEWSFGNQTQSAVFKAQKSKPVVGEEEYMHMIKPLMETWMRSVET